MEEESLIASWRADRQNHESVTKRPPLRRTVHMRAETIPAVALLVTAFTASSCAQEAPEMPSFASDDAAAVRANLDTYMQADPLEEPETFFSQFTDDVYWLYDQNEPWVGLEALRAVEWCGTISATITADRVEGSGDLAYARGTYSLSLDCGEDTPTDSQGVFLSMHRRQSDGSWLIESLLQVARSP